MFLPWNRISKLVSATAAIAAMGVATPALSQSSFPSQPIRLIVPFAPGGAADTLARALANNMSEQSGNTVVVENRAGAGGTIGTASVARSAPDGYTLLLGNVSTLATAPSLYTKLSYDPLKDFTPLTLVGKSPLVFAATPSLQADTLRQLVDDNKSHGDLNYGSSGSGSITHLTGELLNNQIGNAIVHVPYKGSAPVLVAVMGGELQLGVTQVSEMLQQFQAGQVKALGITGNQRLDVIPDVATAAEQGISGLDATTWYAVVGPKDIPQDVTKTLHAMLVKALDDPEFKKRYASEGLLIQSSTPEELQALMTDEIPAWKEVVTRANVKLD